MPNRPFIPGLELCGLFYRDAVRPLLDADYPGLAHSGARLGFGSDVLGFDTSRSTDHGWGPKLDLFLSPADHERHAAEIGRVLAEELPRTFRGYSTHFAGQDAMKGWMVEAPGGPIRHGVSIYTVGSFCRAYLGFDPGEGIGPVDWLTCPQQRLRTVASGRVYHDGLGELEPLRSKLGYYPRDVWLYLLAAQWQRIAQEEPFMGRAGDVGDELGSRVIAARLVRDVMRLCFLLERRYAPYGKWLGTAFSQLACGPRLRPILARALAGRSWQEREEHLSLAYEAVAAMHNELGITEPLPGRVSLFYGRPYRVIQAGDFAAAILARIEDPQVRRLPAFLGAVDQFADSTDVLDAIHRCRRLRALYAEERPGCG